MKITRHTVPAGAVGTPDEAALEKINRFAQTPLTAQQVYCFSLRLADDQPDRDNERFAAEALPELARLLVGKTGILDHNWSASGQVARIYDTSVVCENGESYIRAEAYVLRTAGNEELIAAIGGGIFREVSVGCSMGTVQCSICGQSYGSCSHRKGQIYDGQRCLAVLGDPQDAYEFSFVAVPAQRQAGVIKAFSGLKTLVEEAGSEQQRGDYARLLEKAALADRYLSELRAQVIRLGLTVDCGLTRAELELLTDGLDEGLLLRLKSIWQRTAQGMFPEEPQLSAPAPSSDSDAFRI